MTREKREPEDLYLHCGLVVSVLVAVNEMLIKSQLESTWREPPRTVLGAVCTHPPWASKVGPFMFSRALERRP